MFWRKAKPEPPQPYLKDVFKGIDDTGKAMQAVLNRMWVPWNPETGAGHVYWHATAAGHLQEGLRRLLELEEYMNDLNWPEGI